MATGIATKARDVAAKARGAAEKAYESGHFRRARQRLSQAMEGSKPNDILVQATAAAVASSVAMNVLRTTVVGKFVARWAPLFVFAAVYQRRMEGRRR